MCPKPSRIKAILPKIHKPASPADRWYIYYSVEDPLTGKKKRFRHYEGFAECESEAKKATHALSLKRRYQRRLLKGWNPFEDTTKVVWKDTLAYQVKPSEAKIYGSKTSIKYMINEFMVSRASKGLTKKSIEAYVTKFRIFKEWLEGVNSEMEIESFDQGHARDFMKYISTNKMRKGKTVNGYRTLLKGLWIWASVKDDTLSNPWRGTEKRKERVKAQKPFPLKLIKVIKKKLLRDDPQLWMAVQMIYYCFIRPKEMRLLKVGDINFDMGKIVLQGEITKNGSVRTVDIPEAFKKELIERYNINTYPEWYYVYSVYGKPSENICGRDYLSKRFLRVRREMQIPDEYKFYGFKHTGAVVAIMNGANVVDIQNQMGHSSIEMTSEYLKNISGHESGYFKNQMPEL